MMWFSLLTTFLAQIIPIKRLSDENIDNDARKKDSVKWV